MKGFLLFIAMTVTFGPAGSLGYIAIHYLRKKRAIKTRAGRPDVARSENPAPAPESEPPKAANDTASKPRKAANASEQGHNHENVLPFRQRAQAVSATANDLPSELDPAFEVVPDYDAELIPSEFR